MSQRRWTIMLILILGVLSLGLYGVGQAAGRPGGTGPDDALALPDGWQTLAPGQQTWYAFNYAGDKSDVLVQLSASPAGSAAFEVWSPTDVDLWRRAYATEPTGRGSANARLRGDLVWSGSGNYGGTWYVVVKPSAEAQTWYDLKVSGSGV